MVLPGLAGLTPLARGEPVAWPAPYAQADFRAWSNGVPVLDIDGPWAQGYDPRSGPQRAYQAMQVEAGAAIQWPWWPDAGTWRLGVLARSEAYVALSGPGAQVAYHYQSRQDPATPQAFDAHADVLSWRGRGVALHGPQWPLGPWASLTWSASVQWLALQRLRHTLVDGQVRYLGAGGYDHQLQIQDDSATARPPFLPAPASQGAGQTLSLSLRWQASPDIVWSAQAQDLWSRLHWADLNALQARLDTQVSSKTVDGYIDYQPELTGQYTPHRVATRIPRALAVQGQWQRPEGLWSLRLHHQWGLQQTWLGWQSPGADGWSLAVEPRFGAWQVGTQWRGWSARLMADRLDAGAHVRQVSLAYQWAP